MPLKEGAINEILPFASEALTDAGDILSQADYEKHPMRLRGHLPGLALRELQNKEARQSTHMAAGLAQFIANRHEAGVKDDGDLDKVEAGLDAAVKAIIKDTPTVTPLKAGFAPIGAEKNCILGVSDDGKEVIWRGIIEYLIKALPKGSPGYVLTIADDGSLEFKELREQDKYDVGQTYLFMDEAERPGMASALGGVIENVSRFPAILEYLQTPHGQKRCFTQADWDARHVAIWHTNADGTTVGWNGIGGVTGFVWDRAADTLRMPDLADMVAVAAGGSLGVGEVQGYGFPHVTGSIPHQNSVHTGAHAGTGVFATENKVVGFCYGNTTTYSTIERATFDIATQVPIADKIQTNSYGVLPCVYLGRPR